MCSLEVKNLVTIPKSSNPQKFKDFLLQKCKNWDLTENAFWCVSSLLVKPQRHTVPHFKEKCPKNLILELCLYRVKNKGTTTTNSQPLILLQKRKS